MTAGDGPVNGDGADHAVDPTAEPGTDEVTPFEFALAGVAPPEGTTAPSLTAIEDMRALVERTPDAPVTNVGLEDFLVSGGQIARRNEQRARRWRAEQIVGSGTFIDITPSELTNGNGNGDHHDEPAPTEPVEAPHDVPIEPVEAPHDLPIDPVRLRDAVEEAVATTDLDLGAIEAAANGGRPALLDIDPAEVDPTDLVETGEALTAPPVDGPAPIALDPAADVVVEPEPDAAAAAVAAVAADAGIDRVQADLQALLDPPTAADPAEAPTERGAGVFDVEVGEERPAIVAPAPIEPAMSADDAAPVEPVIVAEQAVITDRLRDESGRFSVTEALGGDLVTADLALGETPPGPAPLDVDDLANDDLADHQLADGDEQDDQPPLTVVAAAGGAAVVAPTTPTSLFPEVPDAIDEPADRDATVVAAGGLLAPEAESFAGPPLATAAAPAPVVATSGRATGTIIAAIGAAAAAAALIAGSLWWTSNASNRTESEAAPAAPSTSATNSESSTSAADGSDQTSGSLDSGGVAEGSSTRQEGQTSEFGSDTSVGPSSTEPIDRTTVSVARPSTTAPATTEASTTEATASTTATDPSSTETTAPESTTTTDAVSTTVTAPTTEPPTTVAPALAYIGDRVTVGGYDGDGLAGVTVTLWLDANDDGRVDRQIASRRTNADGGYFFDVEAGCYAVRFNPPDGYQIRAEMAEQYLCLRAGEIAARVDALADVVAAPVAPPTGCEVEEAGSSPFLGVEVHETGGNWADSYIFYGSGGSVVARTSNLGRHDHQDNSNEREWWGQSNGFNHRDVRSVSAVRDGDESAAVACAT